MSLCRGEECANAAIRPLKKAARRARCTGSSCRRRRAGRARARLDTIRSSMADTQSAVCVESRARLGTAHSRSELHARYGRLYNPTTRSSNSQEASDTHTRDRRGSIKNYKARGQAAAGRELAVGAVAAVGAAAEVDGRQVALRLAGVDTGRRAAAHGGAWAGIAARRRNSLRCGWHNTRAHARAYRARFLFGGFHRKRERPPSPPTVPDQFAGARIGRVR